MRLHPSDICYSQDSISCEFDDGTLIGKLVDDIAYGMTDIYEIPKISVAYVQGKWFTTDNRRLWVFRKLEEIGVCDWIPVRVVDQIPSHKMTTMNLGVDIEVRGSPGGRLDY